MPNDRTASLLYLAYAASPGLTCQTPPCASIFLAFRLGEVPEVFNVFALAAFDAVCAVVALAVCVALLPCCFRELRLPAAVRSSWRGWLVLLGGSESSL